MMEDKTESGKEKVELLDDLRGQGSLSKILCFTAAPVVMTLLYAIQKLLKVLKEKGEQK